jgi:glycine C-acetyltransferase
MGTIASLVGPDDVIVMDKLAHACIVDSALLAQGNFRVFRHNDMDSLESTLKHVNKGRKGGVLIVTEGTYGMTGDLASLPDIIALKKKYDARLFIDDAHGVGVMGETGRGAGEFFDVQEDIDLYFGTFAKAFASIGGFTAGPTDVIDWIRYNARTQVFAKSLPMVFVKSLIRTLKLIREGEERRERMWEVSNALKEGLRKLGFFVGPGAAPICPVWVTTTEEVMEETATQMVKFLRDRGVFVTAVAYPVIPKGFLMFRMIPTASHSDEDVIQTLDIFKQMRLETKLTVGMNKEQEAKINKLYGI